MYQVRNLMATVAVGLVLTSVPSLVEAQSKPGVIRVAATVVNGPLSIAEADSVVAVAAREVTPAERSLAVGVRVFVRERTDAVREIEKSATTLPPQRVRTVTIEYVAS